MIIKLAHMMCTWGESYTNECVFYELVDYVSPTHKLITLFRKFFCKPVSCKNMPQLDE